MNTVMKNPLLQRYWYSQLRPRQIGIYTFLYVAIVAIIWLMNYTVFSTLRSFIFGDIELINRPDTSEEKYLLDKLLLSETSMNKCA